MIRSSQYRDGMASKQPEIIRTLDDGFVVAWDTTEVSDAVRSGLERLASEQADLLVKILRDDGSETVQVVEAKAYRATVRPQQATGGRKKETTKAGTSARRRVRRAASA